MPCSRGGEDMGRSSLVWFVALTGVNKEGIRLIRWGLAPLPDSSTMTRETVRKRGTAWHKDVVFRISYKHTLFDDGWQGGCRKSMFRRYFT